MKTKQIIATAIGLLLLVAFCFLAGYFSHRQPKESAPLTIDYIKYWGFEEIAGGGLIHQMNQVIIPGTRDTITSYAAIIPDNKDNPKFYVIGMADLVRGQGYRFVRVDVIDKQIEFDRWVKFIKLEEK